MGLHVRSVELRFGFLVQTSLAALARCVVTTSVQHFTLETSRPVNNPLLFYGVADTCVLTG